MKLDTWKQRCHALKKEATKIVEAELENNRALTAQIAVLKKTVHDQESAFRGQEATIRHMKERMEAAEKKVADFTSQIHANNRRFAELEADIRIMDQTIAIEKAKVDFARGIILKKDEF